MSASHASVDFSEKADRPAWGLDPILTCDGFMASQILHDAEFLIPAFSSGDSPELVTTLTLLEEIFA